MKTAAEGNLKTSKMAAEAAARTEGGEVESVFDIVGTNTTDTNTADTNTTDTSATAATDIEWRTCIADKSTFDLSQGYPGFNNNQCEQSCECISDCCASAQSMVCLDEATWCDRVVGFTCI